MSVVVIMCWLCRSCSLLLFLVRVRWICCCVLDFGGSLFVVVGRLCCCRVMLLFGMVVVRRGCWLW